MTRKPKAKNALDLFHPAVREWFASSFASPTKAQQEGWPAIANGDWTLIFAPTGSGKTLTAFLWALDRLMFRPRPPKEQRCRVLYLSPLKALAVDVERNLRAPLAGISNVAQSRGDLRPAGNIENHRALHPSCGHRGPYQAHCRRLSKRPDPRKV